ncbi:MAG: hypothetical protein ACYDDF_08790 [Thermoplasmatota archaeon]
MAAARPTSLGSSGTSRGLRSFLASTDWTFRTASTRELTHGIHPYPARMVPPLAQALIPRLAPTHEMRVFDPFAGSGTVLLEALRCGRPSQGFDINPLAILIARVKTRRVDAAQVQAFVDRLARSLSRAPDADRDAARVMAEAETAYGLIHPADWFPPAELAALLHIEKVLRAERDRPLREIGLVALSKTVRAASFIRPSSFKLYRRSPEDRADHALDVRAEFLETSRAIADALRSLNSIGPSDPEVAARVTFADARTDTPEPYALLLTSPPYGDSRTTVAYGQFSELSSKVLRLAEEFDLTPTDLRRLDQSLLGGRPNDAPLLSKTASEVERKIRQGRPDRADQFHWFFADYQQVLVAQLPHLAPGGYAVFVVGNRTVARQSVPMHAITRELAESAGLRYVANLERDIPNKVLPSRNAPENIVGHAGATMTRENIVILRKPG